MASHLPLDALIEILVRLPVKSLLRCTSVSKHWHSVITHPTFLDTHLNRQKNDSLWLVRTCSDYTQKEVYSWHCDDETFTEVGRLSPFDVAYNNFYRIVESCNGVLCLTDEHPTFMDEAILWNPAMRKWVKLPSPRVAKKSLMRFEHTIGFGFDAASNEYKVISIVYLRRGRKVSPKVDVYTMSSETWKNANHLAVGFKHLIIGHAPQAYFDGAIHWIVEDRKAHRNTILSFCMGDEAFRCIELPTSLSSCTIFRNLDLMPAVLEGLLSVVETKSHMWKCCIWMMKEYGVASSWTPQHVIDFFGTVKRPLFGFRKNGHVLVELDGDLYSCDPKTKVENGYVQATELDIHSKTGRYFENSLHVVSYIESLVLVGSRTEDILCNSLNEMNIADEEGNMTTVASSSE